jgi:methylthioribulose 1-phosphate dehydratase/enolase-phosphatase E1
VYVWGKDWIAAKTQAECYEYLFEAAVRMAALGIDASRAPAPLIAAPAAPAKRAAGGEANGGAAANGAAAEAVNGGQHAVNGSGGYAKRAKLSHAKQPAAIVLDIEGTVAPISYVADVMFPYARDNVRSHLELTYDSAETQEDIEAIRAQAAADGQGVVVPGSEAGKAAVVEAVVGWVNAAIAADRKVRRAMILAGAVFVLLTHDVSVQLSIERALVLAVGSSPKSRSKWT